MAKLSLKQNNSRHGNFQTLFWLWLQQPKLKLPRASTRLEVLGTVQIKLDGVTTPVRGRKRQELLAVLLEARSAGRNEASKLELLDVLYPDTDEIRGQAALKEVVHQVRSIFGQNIIQTSLSGYTLGNVQSDAEEFFEHFETTHWRGAYLNGLSLDHQDDAVRSAIHLALRTRLELRHFGGFGGHHRS